MFHAGLALPGGFVGVDVFFVISGFVITAMLHREWSATGRVRLRRFFARRFTRLSPAVALTVTVTMLMTALIVSPLGPQQNAAVTGIGTMFLAANVAIANTTGGYFSAAADTNPLLNMWSLSVEEQFYLVFPFLLLGAWMLGRKVRSQAAVALAVVAVCAAASFALALVDEGQFSTPWIRDALGFYSPIPRAWEFAAGALLALVLANRGKAVAASSVPSAVPTGLAIVGAAGLVASLFLITEATPFPGVWTLLPVVSTVLLIAAGSSGSQNPVSRMLASTPMVRVGDWSYSIYLWHWPFIVLATTLWPGTVWVAPLAALLSVVPAVLSYRFVEQPLRTRTYAPPAFMALVGLAVAIPVTISALVWLSASNGHGNPTIRAYQSATQPQIGTSCDDPGRVLPGATIGCSSGTDLEGPPVYLVGDSHADHVSEAVFGAAEDSGRPAFSRIAPGCQLFPAILGTVGEEPLTRCVQYFDDTMAWLTDAEPGSVVISTASRPFWEPALQLGPTIESLTTDAAQKLAYLDAGLTVTIRDLQSAGHSVVVVHDSPTFVGEFEYTPTECSLPALVAGSCERVLPLDVAEDQLADVRATLDAVAGATGSQTVDLVERVCSADGCASRRGDVIVYSDSGHLSASFSRTLSDSFLSALTP